MNDSAGSGDPNDEAIALGRTVGLGCFSLFVGTWSGGIVGVLIGRFIEGARRAPSCEGLPVCNWPVYASIGALAGAVSLPFLVLRRLRRGRRQQRNPRG